MTGQKPWADGPFKLVSKAASGAEKGKVVKGAQFVAMEMSTVHNMHIRGINSIYRQCINVQTQGNDTDIKDFVDYSLTWVAMIHEHHDTEEESFFPMVEEKSGEKGIMDVNVDQHKAFHDGLDAFENYLKSVKDGKEKYSGEKMKEIIDSFGPALTSHLNEEIQTLMGLSKYDGKVNWEKVLNDWVGKLMRTALANPEWRVLSFPYAFTHHEKAYEDGVWANWPPVPWFMMIIFKVWLIPQKKNLWRFSPCDASGVRKELPFA